MIVYHGTTMEIHKPDIKHSKAHLDFGVGFYTTSFQKQAERWAARKGIRLSITKANWLSRLMTEAMELKTWITDTWFRI